MFVCILSLHVKKKTSGEKRSLESDNINRFAVK